MVPGDSQGDHITADFVNHFLLRLAICTRRGTEYVLGTGGGIRTRLREKRDFVKRITKKRMADGGTRKAG